MCDPNATYPSCILPRMATATLSASNDIFAVGDVVIAYPRASWKLNEPVTGAPDPGLQGVSEVQTVTIDATGGTFTLTFGGQTTSAIAFDAAASAVQTALQALSTIGAGNVLVTGSAGGPYTVTFVGTLKGVNVAQLTSSAASLTGGAGTVTHATTTAGADGRVASATVDSAGVLAFTGLVSGAKYVGYCAATGKTVRFRGY